MCDTTRDMTAMAAVRMKNMAVWRERVCVWYGSRYFEHPWFSAPKGVGRRTKNSCDDVCMGHIPFEFCPKCFWLRHVSTGKWLSVDIIIASIWQVLAGA